MSIDLNAKVTFAGLKYYHNKIFTDVITPIDTILYNVATSSDIGKLFLEYSPNQLFIQGVDNIVATLTDNTEKSFSYDSENPPILESDKIYTLVVSNGGNYNTFLTTLVPDDQNPIKISPVLLTVDPGVDSMSSDGVQAYGDKATPLTSIFKERVGTTHTDNYVIIRTNRYMKLKVFDFITSGSNNARYDVYGSNDGENWSVIARVADQTFQQIPAGDPSNFYRYGNSSSTSKGNHIVGRMTLLNDDPGYYYHKFVHVSGSNQLYGLWLLEAYWVD